VDVYGDVEPLAGFGPADVELIGGRHDDGPGIVVDGVVEVVELGVGDVDALAHAELVEVVSIGRVELTGAVVDGIGVVVGDAFSSVVVEGALDFAGDGLGNVPGSFDVGGSLVSRRKVGLCDCGDGEEE